MKKVIQMLRFAS